MKAFNRITKARCPGKRNKATAAPSGMPMTAARNTAVRLTHRESPTISVNFGSKLTTSANAAAKASLKSIMNVGSKPRYIRANIARLFGKPGKYAEVCIRWQ